MLVAFNTAIGRAPTGNLIQAIRAFVLCTAVACVFLAGAEFDAVWTAFIAVSAFSLGVYAYYAKRYSFRKSSDAIGQQFRFASQHIYSVVIVGVDVVILKLAADNEAVAIYGVALFLSNIASFALYAINANYTAPISKAIKHSERSETQALLTNVAKINMALSAPFFVALILVSLNLSFFYGSEYRLSETLALILIGGQVFNVFVGSVALVANVSGNESRISSLIAQSLVFKVVAGLVATWFFGVVGMAIVAAMANALWNTRAFWMVYKEIGLNTTILKLIERP